jgi:hypothetical protein
MSAIFVYATGAQSPKSAIAIRNRNPQSQSAIRNPIDNSQSTIANLNPQSSIVQIRNHQSSIRN